MPKTTKAPPQQHATVLKVTRDALAQALRKARPATIPGTSVIPDDTARKVWYDCVTEVAEVVCRGDTAERDRIAAAAFFDAAGVPN